MTAAVTVRELLADVEHLAIVLDRRMEDLVVEALLEYVEVRQAEAERTIRRLLTPRQPSFLRAIDPPPADPAHEAEEAVEAEAIRAQHPGIADTLARALAADTCARRRRPSPDPWRIDRHRREPA